MHEQLNRMTGVSLSAKTFTPKQRLSSRPGRVLEDVRADLPWPRNLSGLKEPEFVKIKAELFALVRDVCGGSGFSW